MSKLEVLTDEQLAPLLAESEHAFLPTKNNPAQTSASLVKKFKSDKKYNALGYVIDDTAITYILALSGRTDNEIAIGPIYVMKNFRGNGLGKRQIAEFIQLFTKQGYESIYTKTWLGNIISQHSFESIGFIEVGRKAGDRIGGDSTISYALQTTHS